MAKETNPRTTESRGEALGDKPAKTLIKAWGKKMAQGSAVIIPVFIGGSWTLQVPRGNKRMLQFQVGNKKN